MFVPFNRFTVVYAKNHHANDLHYIVISNNSNRSNTAVKTVQNDRFRTHTTILSLATCKFRFVHSKKGIPPKIQKSVCSKCFAPKNNKIITSVSPGITWYVYTYIDAVPRPLPRLDSVLFVRMDVADATAAFYFYFASVNESETAFSTYSRELSWYPVSTVCLMLFRFGENFLPYARFVCILLRFGGGRLTRVE